MPLATKQTNIPVQEASVSGFEQYLLENVRTESILTWIEKRSQRRASVPAAGRGKTKVNGRSPGFHGTVFRHVRISTAVKLLP